MAIVNGDLPLAEHHQWTIPLIACESQGGRYPDEPFLAGLAVGLIHQALGTLAQTPGGVSVMFAVPADLVEQLELLAIDRGFTLARVVEATGQPGTVYIRFAIGPTDDLDHPERVTG